MGASAVAAAMLLKQKQVIAAFRTAGAMSPDTARTPAAMAVDEGLAFRKLRGHAVLLEAEPGRFYLDEAKWETLRLARRRMAFAVLVMAAALALFAISRS